MIQVKDKLQEGYKGRLTYATDKCCVCRSCFNPHDCGYYSSNGEWIGYMHCATNYNKGCPDLKPEPVHMVRFSQKNLKGQTRKCLRCGQTIQLEKTKFTIKEKINGN